MQALATAAGPLAVSGGHYIRDARRSLHARFSNIAIVAEKHINFSATIVSLEGVAGFWGIVAQNIREFSATMQKVN